VAARGIEAKIKLFRNRYVFRGNPFQGKQKITFTNILAAHTLASGTFWRGWRRCIGP
jgi:hypothetical protein